MKGYIHRHLATGKYEEASDGDLVYRNRSGWLDIPVGENIIFSHRVSDYEKENFPEHLHNHDYCELLFWERGEVQYLCGDRSITPRDGCVIMIPSGKSHTARLVAPSTYERFVLYFTPAAFDFSGQSTALSEELFSESEPFSFCLSAKQRDEVRNALYRIEELLQSKKPDDRLLAYAEITLLIGRLKKDFSTASTDPSEEVLPKQVQELRNYLDENYNIISSVEEVAAHFYYSREYASRLFAKYFNLSPWKYVEQLRIRDACARIDRGEKITEVCYSVGYRSMSAFSASFRRLMGASPTEYRRNK
ncbi:MAG: AraC family transcriptional regulator [Clostridia bacterium]|nr:AraC family transcriptional regulator [Clostridia bacterium]